MDDSDPVSTLNPQPSSLSLNSRSADSSTPTGLSTVSLVHRSLRRHLSHHGLCALCTVLLLLPIGPFVVWCSDLKSDPIVMRRYHRRFDECEFFDDLGVLLTSANSEQTGKCHSDKEETVVSCTSTPRYLDRNHQIQINQSCAGIPLASTAASTTHTGRSLAAPSETERGG